jgi:hypothetical protein
VVVFALLLFFLFLLPLDGQNVTGGGDINIFRINARNLGLYYDIVIGLRNIKRRNPPLPRGLDVR